MRTLQAWRRPAAVDNVSADAENMSVEDSLQILYPTVVNRIPANSSAASRAMARQPEYDHATEAGTIDGCITVRNTPRTPAFISPSQNDTRVASLLRQSPFSTSAAAIPADLAQSFISSYQARSSQIKPEVLELMAKNNSQFLAEHERLIAASTAEESLIDASMRTVVASSFAAIEPYAAELNHRLARTEMRIACTPPDLVAENTGNIGSKEISYYRARISSKTFSIVIRGSGTTVNFYMMPVSLVMALSKSEDQFEPLMSFTATAHGACLDWQVEGKPLTSERQERYCLLLFNYLLEQTREQMAMHSSQVRRA